MDIVWLLATATICLVLGFMCGVVAANAVAARRRQEEMRANPYIGV